MPVRLNGCQGSGFSRATSTTTAARDSTSMSSVPASSRHSPCERMRVAKEAWRQCEVRELGTGCIMTTHDLGCKVGPLNCRTRRACGGARAPRVAQATLDLAQGYTRALERGKHGGGYGIHKSDAVYCFLCSQCCTCMSSITVTAAKK